MRPQMLLYTRIIFLVILLSGSASHGDVIALHDGSRIVGTVVRASDCTVEVQTDFAGKLMLPMTKVLAFEVDRPVHVRLISGEQYFGSLSAAQSGQAITLPSSGSQIHVAADQVAFIWEPGTDSPEAAAKRPKWTGAVEAGITSTEGNSDTLVGRVKIGAKRKTKDDLLSLYASADYSEQNDIRNRNEYIAGARFEHSLSRRWFWYARSELEYDEFENLDLRATVAGGLGYYWIREEAHELKTLAGPGYRYQEFNNGVTTDDVILDLGLDYRLDLCEWAQFTHSTVYSPTVDDFANYRVTLDTALTMPIATSLNWKIKLGVRNDYNSRPLKKERLDNTAYANLVYEWK